MNKTTTTIITTVSYSYTLYIFQLPHDRANSTLYAYMAMNFTVTDPRCQWGPLSLRYYIIASLCHILDAKETCKEG